MNKMNTDLHADEAVTGMSDQNNTDQNNTGQNFAGQGSTGQSASADDDRKKPTGTALVAAHVGTLMFDPYAQLKVADVLLPFLGAVKPVWQGLGTLALDLLAIVTVVSLLRHKVGPRVFKAVHWATYALWPIALVHALGNGTDASSPWMLGFAAVSTAAVAGTVTWRLLPSFRNRGWQQRIPRVLPHERQA